LCSIGRGRHGVDHEWRLHDAKLTASIEEIESRPTKRLLGIGGNPIRHYHDGVLTPFAATGQSFAERSGDH
jgi:hypothetical protein